MSRSGFRIGQELVDRHISFGHITNIGALLADIVPSMDVKAMYDYPELISGQNLKRLTIAAASRKSDHKAVVVASMMALVKNRQKSAAC